MDIRTGVALEDKDHDKHSLIAAYLDSSADPIPYGQQFSNQCRPINAPH